MHVSAKNNGRIQVHPMKQQIIFILLSCIQTFKIFLNMTIFLS